jgi:hypothetical protein
MPLASRSLFWFFGNVSIWDRAQSLSDDSDRMLTTILGLPPMLASASSDVNDLAG